MFLDILGEPRSRLLRKVLADPPVPNAYLAGGTALALILGHRESVDFGWFSPAMFDAEAVAERLSQLGQLHISETKKGTFHGFVNDIQVTWLYYPNPLLEEFITSPEIPGLYLASLVDIAVMKWSALSSRGSRKDFIDLYFIAQAGLEIQSLVPLLAKKFPDSNINYYHMIKSLSYFDDAEHEAWPVMHKSVQWEEVKAFFRQQQKLLLDKCLCT
jgi:hypothetical protein